MPRISIITPFYNAENTLAETAASVLGQSYSDWEWILFNDYSTDGSLELANHLSLQDSRIKVFSNSATQRGPSHARNSAVANSSGDLLAFLDADDVWLPEYLASRVQDLTENKDALFVYGPSLYLYKERTHLQDTGITKTTYFSPATLIEIFISHPGGTPCPSAAVVRRAAFYQVSGFRTELLRGEDIAFFIELNTVGGVFYQSAQLVRYRRHSDSATSRANKFGDRLLMELKYYTWLHGFAIANRRTDCLRLVEYRFYSHLVEIEKHRAYLISRVSLLQQVRKSPLSIRVYLYWMLDCLLPFILAKRLRYYAFKVLS